MARRKRTQADKDRQAQDRFRRAGQPVGRLRGAEYRWRKYHAGEIARAAGVELSPGQAAGKPRKGELSISELRAREVLRPARETTTPRLPAEPRHTRLGSGADIYKTTSRTYMRGVLRDAERNGRVVSILITARFGPNGEIRSRRVTGYEYEIIEFIEKRIAAAKDRRRVLRAVYKTVRIIKKPEFYITTDPGSITGGGLDPEPLADYLDAYADFLAALGDLWAVVPS